MRNLEFTTALSGGEGFALGSLSLLLLTALSVDAISDRHSMHKHGRRHSGHRADAAREMASLPEACMEAGTVASAGREWGAPSEALCLCLCPVAGPASGVHGLYPLATPKHR